MIIESKGENSTASAEIYDSIGLIYVFLEYRDEALKYLKKAILINEKYHNELSLASNYNQMSKIYIYISGDVKVGLSYLEKAETIYKKYSWESTFSMAGVLSNKGRLYQSIGEYERALVCYEESLEIYEKNNYEDEWIYILMG